MYNFNIIKLDAIPSTNDFLKQKYQQQEAKDDDVVWALHQTKGRGQQQNTWISSAGENLTVSVYKVFTDFFVSEAFLLNTAVCMAIINTISSFRLTDIKVKWPNDILSENKKNRGRFN